MAFDRPQENAAGIMDSGAYAEKPVIGGRLDLLC
jgi:hypothetical protein